MDDLKLVESFDNIEQKEEPKKRGRGRPRKYPKKNEKIDLVVPESATESVTESATDSVAESAPEQEQPSIIDKIRERLSNYSQNIQENPDARRQKLLNLMLSGDINISENLDKVRKIYNQIKTLSDEDVELYLQIAKQEKTRSVSTGLVETSLSIVSRPVAKITSLDEESREDLVKRLSNNRAFSQAFSETVGLEMLSSLSPAILMIITSLSELRSVKNKQRERLKNNDIEKPAESSK